MIDLHKGINRNSCPVTGILQIDQPQSVSNQSAQNPDPQIDCHDQDTGQDCIAENPDLSSDTRHFSPPTETVLTTDFLRLLLPNGYPNKKYCQYCLPGRPPLFQDSAGLHACPYLLSSAFPALSQAGSHSNQKKERPALPLLYLSSDY